MSGQFEWALERMGDAPRPDARVLLLGDARSLAPALAQRGWAPDVIDDSNAHAFDEGSAEAALILGALERTEWDRWLLQRVHRALGPGGRVVIAAQDASRIASLDDVRYWIDGAIKTMRLKLTKRPGPFRRRKYRDGRLREMLEPLGFAVDHFEIDRKHGFIIVARRLASLYGLEPDRPYPDAAQVLSEGGGTYDDSMWGWAPEFAEWIAPAPRELDPAAHRGASALVLAPHPDDELIGCGGTSLRLMEAGASVHVLHATDGSDAASLWTAPEEFKRRVRLEEAERVSRAAGYASIELWREPNDGFQLHSAMVSRLVATLERIQPRIVFVPFMNDIHPDHRRLSRLLRLALEQFSLGSEAEVASYQVWGGLPANTWCDVTAQMPRLERLLWLYETAMKVDDYVHFCAERNHYNALAFANRPGFAEVFHLAPAAQYPKLLRSTDLSS